MSLPRLFLSVGPEGGDSVELGAEQARHLAVLRLRPGSALELALPSGVWRADLAELGRDRAVVRLVAPLEEDREPPFPIHVHLPVTAQLSSLEEILAPIVELGATVIQPVAYARSEADFRKLATRMDRWRRILVSACEQSHRGRIPELRSAAPFAALLECPLEQKWFAYEVRSGSANPGWNPAPLALTSGPEGGITDGEAAALMEAGWLPVSLGGSILRAVTAPVALLGAARFQMPA